MKKFTAVIMAAFLVLSLTACSGGNNSESSGSASNVSDNSSAADISSEPENSSEPDESSETDTSSKPDTSSEPETSKPESSTPETSTPESSAPETSAPETSVPESSTPETTPPATTTTPPATTTTPSTSKPETSKPETSTPETSKPETSEPETSKPETSEPEEVSVTDPVTLLNNVYALFGDDERFPATGGDFSTGELIEGAGVFGLAEPDALDNVIGYPAAEIAKIDNAATLTHMMNQNTFSSGAYHVVAGTDVAALAEAIRANIQNRMWCCGFPERLIVATVDDYVISAFGKEFAISAFTTHLAEAYPTSEILIDEPIL